MAGYLGDLVLRLKAETADFRQDLGKAASSADRNFKSIARSAEQLGKALGIGIGLGAVGFLALAKNTIDAQDALAKLSQKVNVSVVDLAGWQHAADLAGVNSESLTKGIKSLTTQMFDASRGLKESQDNFDALGISVRDSSGHLKKTTDVLMELADLFVIMPDSAEKSALAVKLLGKAGLDMIPLLNGGSSAIREMISEGQRLNPVTAESAAQAEIFNDNMLRLQKSVASVGIKIVNDLLPGLSSLAKLFADESMPSDIRATGREAAKLGDNFNPFIETLKTAVILGSDFAYVWRTIGIAAAGTWEQMNGLKSGGIEGFKKSRELVRGMLEEERRKLDEFQAKVMAAGTGKPPGKPVIPTVPGDPTKDMQEPFIPKVRNAQDDAKQRAALAEQKKFESAQQALEKMIGSVNRQTQEQITTYAVLKGSLQDLLKPHKDRLVALAKEYDAMKIQEDLRKAVIDQIEMEEKNREQLNKAVDDQVSSYRAINAENEYQISLIGKTADEHERMNALRAIDLQLQKDILALPDAEQSKTLEAIARLRANAESQKKIVLESIGVRVKAERSWATGAKSAIDEYLASISNAAETSKEVVGRAFKSMEDALVQFVKTGKLDFKSLADSIISDLIRIQIRQSIMKPLAEAASGSGGILGGLGKIFGLGGGDAGGGDLGMLSNASAADASFLGSFASGLDYVPRDGLAMIHKGEGILTASENLGRNAGGSGGSEQKFYVDMRGASLEAVQRLERFVNSINASLEPRAVAAVADQNLRGNRS